MRRAALYLRSSKDRHDISIDAQRRDLTGLAKARGLAVVEEFSDAVESGSTDQRPGFQALIRAMRTCSRKLPRRKPCCGRWRPWKRSAAGCLKVLKP